MYLDVEKPNRTWYWLIKQTQQAKRTEGQMYKHAVLTVNCMIWGQLCSPFLFINGLFIAKGVSWSSNSFCVGILSWNYFIILQKNEADRQIKWWFNWDHRGLSSAPAICFNGQGTSPLAPYVKKIFWGPCCYIYKSPVFSCTCKHIYAITKNSMTSMCMGLQRGLLAHASHKCV